jgi:teichuronic acid biosynthesis glycosyltransferase TuaG
MTKNEIAIKIPTYNAEKTIGQTIESLLNQSYKNFQIFIYDNCSTDNTLKIIQTFNDPRLNVIESSKNNGWKWNFDRCLKNEGYPLTLIAHADDIYHREFLDKNLYAINQFKNIDLIFSKGKNFTSYDKISKKINKKLNEPLTLSEYNSYTKIIEELALNGNFIYCPSAFGRSEIFSDVIREFNESEFRGSADLDAWLRVVRNNNTIAIIKSPTIFYYRISGMQISEIERELDESVFVKCMNTHIRSLNNIDINWQKHLIDLIRWHEIYHNLIRDLKKYISKSGEKRIQNINFNVLELLSLQNVRIKRVAKHLLFIFIILMLFILPVKLRVLLIIKLLKFVR